MTGEPPPARFGPEHLSTVLAVDSRRRTATVVTAGTLIVLLVGAAVVVVTAYVRADRASILLVVEDSVPGERRADSVLLATWWRNCDDLTLTSIPRDLVVAPDSEALAVLYDTAGARAMADAVEDLLGVRIGAVVTIDLKGVADIAGAIGPVEIDLPAESLDRRTGFHAGPGPVALVGANAVAYLRSRTWEERFGDDWVLVETTDLDRITHAQTYLAAAIAAVEIAEPSRRVRVGERVLRNTGFELVDPVALAGFLIGAWSHDRIVFADLAGRTRPDHG